MSCLWLLFLSDLEILNISAHPVQLCSCYSLSLPLTFPQIQAKAARGIRESWLYVTLCNFVIHSNVQTLPYFRNVCLAIPSFGMSMVFETWELVNKRHNYALFDTWGQPFWVSSPYVTLISINISAVIWLAVKKTFLKSLPNQIKKEKEYCACCIHMEPRYDGQ